MVLYGGVVLTLEEDDDKNGRNEDTRECEREASGPRGQAGEGVFCAS